MTLPDNQDPDAAAGPGRPLSSPDGTFGGLHPNRPVLLNGERARSLWFPQARQAAPVTPKVASHAIGAVTREGLEAVRDASRIAAGSELLLLTHRKDDDILALLASTLGARGYRTESIESVGFEQVAAAVRERSVRMVVLDVELLDPVELRHLLDVRRRYPAVDWVLVWHSRSDRWVDLVVQFRARGCIERNDLENLDRAIDAILLGTLWFPQWLVHELYAKLLSALREGNADLAKSPGASLTPREAQSLELMRQGLTNKQIALRLQISVNTVKKHLKNAFDKRGLHTRRQGLR